jgi:hypothetical protein
MPFLPGVCSWVCVQYFIFAPQTHLHIHTHTGLWSAGFELAVHRQRLHAVQGLQDWWQRRLDARWPRAFLGSQISLSLSLSLSHTYSLSLCLSNTENSRKTCLCAGITTADIHFHEEIGRGASSTVYRALGVYVCIYLYMYECNWPRLAREHRVSRVYVQTVCVRVHTQKQILPVPVWMSRRVPMHT